MDLARGGIPQLRHQAPTSVAVILHEDDTAEHLGDVRRDELVFRAGGLRQDVVARILRGARGGHRANTCGTAGSPGSAANHARVRRG